MVAEKRLVILKRANKFFKHGKIDASIKEYKKILDIKPNDLEIRRIIGDLELKEKQTGKNLAKPFEDISNKLEIAFPLTICVLKSPFKSDCTTDIKGLFRTQIVNLSY